MKSFLPVLYTLASVALAAAGYFGYTYFTENYVLPGPDDIAALEQNIAAFAQRAFEMGKVACNKTT